MFVLQPTPRGDAPIYNGVYENLWTKLVVPTLDERSAGRAPWAEWLVLSTGLLLHTDVSRNKLEHIQRIEACRILLSRDGLTDSALGYLQK